MPSAPDVAPAPQAESVERGVVASSLSALTVALRGYTQLDHPAATPEVDRAECLAAARDVTQQAIAGAIELGFAPAELEGRAAALANEGGIEASITLDALLAELARTVEAAHSPAASLPVDDVVWGLLRVAVAIDRESPPRDLPEVRTHARRYHLVARALLAGLSTLQRALPEAARLQKGVATARELERQTDACRHQLDLDVRRAESPSPRPANDRLLDWSKLPHDPDADLAMSVARLTEQLTALQLRVHNLIRAATS